MISNCQNLSAAVVGSYCRCLHNSRSASVNNFIAGSGKHFGYFVSFFINFIGGLPGRSAEKPNLVNFSYDFLYSEYPRPDNYIISTCFYNFGQVFIVYSSVDLNPGFWVKFLKFSNFIQYFGMKVPSLTTR